MATENAQPAAEKQQEQAQVPTSAPAVVAEAPVAQPQPAPEIITTTSQPDPLASVAMSEHDRLEAMLADPNWTPDAKPAPAKAAPAVTEQTQAQQPEAIAEIAPEPEPAAETQPAEEPEITDPNALPAGIERPRFTNEDDQIIAALYKKHQREGTPISWAEAESRVKGTPEPVTETPTQADDPIAALQTTLAEVNAKLDEAAERGDLYSRDIDALNQQRAEIIAELKTEQKLAERDARHAAIQQQSEQQTAIGKARESFPSLGVAGSPLNTEANQIVKELEGSKMLTKASAPIDVATMAATRLAQRNAQANGTSFDAEFAKLTGKPAASVSAQAPQVTPPVTRKTVTPASGNQATRTPDKPLTESERFKAASSVSNPVDQYKALEAALYS